MSVGPNDEFDRYWKVVSESPHDFATWEYLIQISEAQGDPVRLRGILLEFLKYFPLCYGYWKKLADLEATHAGDAKVVETYEHAVAVAPYCYEIWFYYTSFIADRATKENYSESKRVFERGMEKIGRQFLSHPFWDRYTQLLDTFNDKYQLLLVLDRLIRIPLQQYPRFYEKYLKTASQRPLHELGSPEELKAYEEKVRQENEGSSLDEEQVEVKIREHILKKKFEVHKKTEDETRKRWHFEDAIVVSYFHVKALDEGQLRNWRSYLDFEEREGDVERTIELYERCLVPCSLYDEIWIRYARYLTRKGLIDQAQSVYNRALSGFLSKKPSLQVAAAIFAEERGLLDQARSILKEARNKFIGHVETIIASVNLERRQGNLAKSEEIYEEGLKVVDDKYTPFLLSHFAKFLVITAGKPEKARKLYFDAAAKYKDSKLLFSNYLTFEISQSGSQNSSDLRVAVEAIKSSNLTNEDKADFFQRYLDFISDQVSTLSSFNEVFADYLIFKNYVPQKKRSAEEDLSHPNKQAKLDEADHQAAANAAAAAAPPANAAGNWQQNYQNYNYPQQQWGYGYGQEWQWNS